MAIKAPYTDPQTGEVSPEAHLVFGNPVMREDTRQVVIQGVLYASKADYDAGKEPIRVYTRTLEQGYAALRTAMLALIEPAAIARWFPEGTRVPD